MSFVRSIRVGYPHILNLPSCHTPWQGEDSCCSVGYPHILNLPSCHTDSTTTHAYPHIIESPCVISLAPCRHSPVPLRRHSRVPAVIPPSLCAVIPASLTSFPRRRESGCAIHEPFYECHPVILRGLGYSHEYVVGRMTGDSRLRGNDGMGAGHVGWGWE